MAKAAKLEQIALLPEIAIARVGSSAKPVACYDWSKEPDNSPDGSGKTTQRKLFKEWLVGEGYKVTTTKWNSSRLIKPIIKARKNLRSINQEEFCLLHAADFRHRLETEVVPALVEGKMVVADRFLFTALARDAARGLELDWLLHIYSP